jgi:hypothetical protein
VGLAFAPATEIVLSATHGIIADGPWKLRKNPDFHARLRELRASIQARHAAEMAKAGFFGRLILRWQIAAEYRRERRKIVPSPHSLFVQQMSLTH